MTTGLEEKLDLLFAEVRALRSEVKGTQKYAVTYEHAAQSLDCGLTKLRQLIRQQKLITVMVGDRPMVPMKEIVRITTPRTTAKRGRPPKPAPAKADLSDAEFRRALRKKR